MSAAAGTAAKPRSQEELMEHFQRLRTDPWYFLSHCVYTLDEADNKNPIKKFPSEGGMSQYLKLYVRCWQNYSFIAVPKSRRMFMSWVNLALYLWDAMFHIGRHMGVVSKKEEDADQLLERMKFILEHIPESELPKDLIPKWERVYCELRFPEISSKIHAYPQGADQLRMFTFSRLLFDELAFWPDAEAAYSSAMPTLEGGGALTAISSPAEGFFQRLVFDEIDQATGYERAAEHVKPLASGWDGSTKWPMEGVEIRRNPKNKFLIFQLHYSADPKKRDPVYRDTIKSTMPSRQYNQEYELIWESYAGTPVYPDFKKETHGSRTELRPIIGLPLLRGWDFGLTPACIIGQLVEDQLRILREVVEVNMGAERFAQLVIAQCQIWFPKWADQQMNWRDFIDPAGFAKSQNNETSCRDELVKAGLAPAPGPVAFVKRRKAVENYLIRVTRDGPRFLIDIGHCPITVRGFLGGYQYPEKAFIIEPTNPMPLKNSYSHPHDGLQYLAHGAQNYREPRKKGVPIPSYSGSQSRLMIGAKPKREESGDDEVPR